MANEQKPIVLSYWQYPRGIRGPKIKISCCDGEGHLYSLFYPGKLRGGRWPRLTSCFDIISKAKGSPDLVLGMVIETRTCRACTKEKLSLSSSQVHRLSCEKVRRHLFVVNRRATLYQLVRKIENKWTIPTTKIKGCT